MAIYTYQRVSTKRQSVGRQDFQLEKLGIKFNKTYTDKLSGKIIERPQLNQLMLDVKEGDIIYVESISRLARNVDDLRSLCAYFIEKGATVNFVKEGISTNGDSYKFLLTVLGAIAEIERERISELVRQGVEKCKESGETKSGRWFGNQNLQLEDLPKDFLKYYTKMKEGIITKVEMQRLLNVSKPTIYRWLRLYESSLSK
jgi:DNA invertase Pin-like site-specific DNA recombinase